MYLMIEYAHTYIYIYVSYIYIYIYTYIYLCTVYIMIRIFLRYDEELTYVNMYVWLPGWWCQKGSVNHQTPWLIIWHWLVTSFFWESRIISTSSGHVWVLNPQRRQMFFFKPGWFISSTWFGNQTSCDNSCALEVPTPSFGVGLPFFASCGILIASRKNNREAQCHLKTHIIYQYLALGYKYNYIRSYFYDVLYYDLSLFC